MVYLAFVMTSGLARPSDMHLLSRQVRFVPITRHSLFKRLIGAGEDIWRDFEAECLGGLKIYNELEARRLFDW